MMRKFEPKEFTEKVENYIKSITATRTLTHSVDTGNKDSKGKPIYVSEPRLNNLGEEVQEDYYFKPPTITSLALYLDIEKSNLIKNYGNNMDYQHSYKKVLAICEQYTESRLLTDKNVAGIIFSLKNNYGWKDKQEFEISAKNKLEDFFVEE